jgi:hypothetical protein
MLILEREVLYSIKRIKSGEATTGRMPWRYFRFDFQFNKLNIGFDCRECGISVYCKTNVSLAGIVFARGLHSVNGRWLSCENRPVCYCCKDMNLIFLKGIYFSCHTSHPTNAKTKPGS